MITSSERLSEAILGKAHGGSLSSPCVLSSLLRAEPGDAVLLAGLLLEVVRALDAAHGEKLRHEPLSPSTILLDEDGKIFLRIAGETDSQKTVVLSGPKYLAPEAFHETNGAWNCARSDAYALGLIFFELILGRDLFRIQFGNEEGGAPAWLAWHADETKRAEPLAVLLATVPVGLSNAIERMMEKDAAKRLHDPTEIARLLRSASETTVIRPAEKPVAASQGHSVKSRTLLDRARAPQFRIPASFRPFRIVFMMLAIAAGAAWLWRSAVSQAPLLPSTIETDGGQMVLLSGVNTLLQAGREGPETKFYLDRKPVSRRAYRAFCESLGRPWPVAEGNPNQRPDEPMRHISWYEARTFAEWAGKRVASVGDLRAGAKSLSEHRMPTLVFRTDAYEWIGPEAGATEAQALVEGQAVAIADFLSLQKRSRHAPNAESIGFRCAAEASILHTSHFLRAVNAE